jgi:SAM-dependent methyltransferase
MVALSCVSSRSDRSMPNSLPLALIAARTLGHYEAGAEGFWQGTRDHDVTQNYAALLDALQGTPPFRILDFGCGPGRDLVAFRELGHLPVGLDGCAAFVDMAKAHSGCEVLHQSFFELALSANAFDGIFANASLFHVPTSLLPKVLGQLFESLSPNGVLFCSNPRSFDGDSEGFHGERYGSYLTVETWTRVIAAAGFTLERQYLRPSGKPPAEQPWSAMVWRKASPQSPG